MDKLTLLQTLSMRFTQYAPIKAGGLSRENDILVTELGGASWKSLDAKEKQKSRKRYLVLAKKYNQPIVYLYYENLILVYDLLLLLLDKLEMLLTKYGMENLDTGLLRISAMALIEKEFMDEYELPKRHVGVVVFSNLTTEFSDLYPDLYLRKFSEAYSNMYRYWPGKQNMTYEDPMNSDEQKTIYNILHTRLNTEGVGLKNYGAESYLISSKSLETTWRNLDSYKKQDKRRELWMHFKHNPESKTSSPYYEKMIMLYDQIIDLLEKLKGFLKDETAIKNAELGILRVCAIFQIEKDYMDEDIIPKHHIQPRFIENLVKEYHETYPDLHLTELSQAYTEMYELWPEKPDKNMKIS